MSGRINFAPRMRAIHYLDPDLCAGNPGEDTRTAVGIGITLLTAITGALTYIGLYVRDLWKGRCDGHISPDVNWLYTISYPIDHPDHTYIGGGMKIRLLRLENGVGAKGAELTTVRTLFGGQGSGNTGGWAPDSKSFAWTEYEALSEQGPNE